MPSLINEHQQWFADDTNALIVNGNVYIGTVGLDPTVLANQIVIYSDRALTTPIANPQPTDANGQTTNKIWIPTTKYSIAVTNSAGVVKYLEPDNGEVPDIINLSDYGADASAIQSAINDGSTIWIGSGTILAAGDSINVNKSVTLRGEPGTIIKLDSSVSSVTLFNITGDKVLFDNITFDINQPTTDTWTNILCGVNGAEEVVFTSTCRFINSASSAYPAANNGYGVYLLGAYGKVTIESGVIFENHRYSVITENSSTGSQIKIGAAYFQNLAGDGVEINVPTGSCDEVSIIGASFKNIGTTGISGRGFAVGASCNTSAGIRSLKIIGCDIQEARIDGIHIEKGVSEFLIVDNNIKGCGIDSATSAGSAVLVAESTDTDTPSRGVINNNIITSAIGSDFGINVSGSLAANNFDISHNNIDGKGNGIGIRFGSVIGNIKGNFNTVKNSNGVGFRSSADHAEIVGNRCYDDQVTKTQTYGLELDSNVQHATIKDNNLIGNINQGISKLDTINVAIPLTGDTIELVEDVSALASANSADTNMIDLGVGAKGTLVFFVRDSTDRAMRMYDIDWDGTTLTPTEISNDSSGVLSISATPTAALTMSGNILRGKYFNGDAITRTADLEMKFNGTILFK